MLGKLLKYELAATGRRLPLLYGVLIAVSVLFGLIIGTGAFNEPVFGRISTAIYVMAAITLGLLTLIILIQRYYKNLLGNEGYLMMTLPAGPGAHVASKIISATIWIILGGLAGVVAMNLLFYFVTDGTWYVSFTAILHMAKGALSVKGGWLVLVELIVLGILLCAEAAAKVYAAISIGHQWSNHRALGAVFAYIGLSVIEAIAAIPLQKVIGEDGYYWTYMSGETVPETQVFFLLLIIVVAVMLAIYWFVSWILIKKRLNLQ
ncbi:MAG: hypothetical protein IKS63_00325 [Firmicutes bacterium]|nr:hypothetical protein [Bacillota bacterium]